MAHCCGKIMSRLFKRINVPTNYIKRFSKFSFPLNFSIHILPAMHVEKKYINKKKLEKSNNSF